MSRNIPLLGILLLLSVPSVPVMSAPQVPSQFPAGPPADASQHRQPDFGQETSPEEQRMRKQAEKELSKQRYQEIRRDSEQLVLLSHQLKRYVDSAGEHTLSLEVIKKAEEIEKLAHNVKTKMKGD